MSFTTDLGTEAMISEFQALNCPAMLPEWLAACALQPDLGEADS